MRLKLLQIGFFLAIQAPALLLAQQREDDSIPEIRSFIEDGKVVRVEVTYVGCGYDFAPKVDIEAPENGKPAVIANGWPQNVVLSDRDILDNTQSIYS